LVLSQDASGEEPWLEEPELPLPGLVVVLHLDILLAITQEATLARLLPCPPPLGCRILPLGGSRSRGGRGRLGPVRLPGLETLEEEVGEELRLPEQLVELGKLLPCLQLLKLLPGLCRAIQEQDVAATSETDI